MNKYDLIKILYDLCDTISTFLSLFSNIGLIEHDSSYNSSHISNESSQNLIHFSIMICFSAFFGLIRLLLNVYNLNKHGTIVNVPEDATKGDFIGIFGEDLSLLCVETIKRGAGLPISTYDLISCILSSFSFCKESTVIMFSIIKAGIMSGNPGDPGMCYCIIFMIGVGLSGFYSLYRFVYLSLVNIQDPCIDMFVLYIAYMIVSVIHTSVICDNHD